ncbi:MAG TPA: hypothetical protein VJB34_02885 [Bdellovibrionota bacterium]|nr:hypothetical protein [Bdellovibrionota bacterium]
MKYFDLMDQLDVDVVSILKRDEFGVRGFIVLKSQRQKGSVPVFISNREDELNLLQEAVEKVRSKETEGNYSGAIVLSPLDNFLDHRKEAFRYVASLMTNFKNINVIADSGVTLEDIMHMQEVNPYIVQDTKNNSQKLSQPESRL